MSEYKPITGELRAAMRQWGWVESDGSITFVTSPMPPSIDAEKALAISGSDFDRLCDAIDSIHAQLERENAALKAELDRVLGEQEDRNGWIEHTEEVMAEHGWVKGPLDADGEMWHIGDMSDSPWGEIESIAFYGYHWQISGHDTSAPWIRADSVRHAHPDTWERIIEDAIGEGMARQRNNDSGNFCERANPMNNGDLVARCKALCERTKGGDAE